MSHLSVEEIDLQGLTDHLSDRLGTYIEASYLRGKTVLRDAIVQRLRCSDFEAEELVETLEMQGYVTFPHLADETHPFERRFWSIGHGRGRSDGGGVARDPDGQGAS